MEKLSTLLPGKRLVLAVAFGFGSCAVAQAQTDASVDALYTLGQLPANVGQHAVRAVVRNQGSTTLTNLPVTLTIRGTTPLTDVRTVPSLAAGQSTVVTFAAYVPTTLGLNTLTVRVPADSNTFNDAATQTQEITTNVFSYVLSTDIASGGVTVPNNGQDEIVACRFTSQGPVLVQAVSVFIPNIATNVGQPLTAVAMSFDGTILARSATHIIQSSDLNGWRRFALPTPVAVSGDFLTGFLIDNVQYQPVGTFSEQPARTDAFYTVQNTANGGPPNDYLGINGTTSRMFIEAEIGPVPACANPLSLTAANVTGTSAQLTFGPGAGNTSYLLRYAPAAGGAAISQTVSASPVTVNGLLPGTAYLATLTGSCGATPATPPARLYFGTVPPNDLCTAPALPVLACGQTLTGTTLGSTSTGDPTGAGFNGDQVWPASGGVFYRFTGTGSAVTLSLCSSAAVYDAMLFVLQGSCGAYTIVASDDDGCGQLGDATLSLLTFPSVAGRAYLVYVSGYTGARGGFSLTANCAGLPDLVVSTPQLVPGGAYNNVTVTGPATGGAGVGTLSNPISVAGTLTVLDGGTLLAECQPITGPGDFVLAAGGTLGICDALGITQSANAGAVRVGGSRSYSNDATYLYNGTSTQVTGDGLPALVRGLAIDNAQDLTLLAGVQVRQVLSLLAGSLDPDTHAVTLLSGPAGTALVHHPGLGTVRGPVTMQRYLSPGLNAGLGYRHLAAPIANATVSTLGTNAFTPVVGGGYNASATPGLTVPFPTVFGYDQSRLASVTSDYSAFDKGWATPAGPASAMQVGEGYTVNIGPTALVNFTGTLNNGPYTRSLSRGAGPDAGWHLLGNPYPSPLNWSLVAPADRANLDAAIYVFESSAQYAGQYRSYANGLGTGNPEIPAGQGFFAHVSAGQAAGSVTFRNSQRVITFGPQAALHRTAADARPQVQLALAGPGPEPADAVVLYAQAGATAGADAPFDAHKLFNPSGLSLSTAIAAGAGTPGELAIDGRPALAPGLVVPLVLRAPRAGTYTLAVNQLLNLSATAVYVHDARTGQQQELHQYPRYAFTLTAAEVAAPVAGRFSLRFGPAAGPLAAAAGTLAAGLAVYPNPAHGQFTVQLPGGAGHATLTLRNSLGQLVGQRLLTLAPGGTTAPVATAGLPAGIYTLRVETAGQAPAVRRVVLE